MPLWDGCDPKISVRAGAAGVDNSLRDTLVIKMRDLFTQHEILKQRRPRVDLLSVSFDCPK